jgi:PucR C-terminal helix-turn-helix domain/GGDEF-like domain
MTRDTYDGHQRLEKARVDVVKRLRSRRAEIEEMIAIRLRDVASDRIADNDAEYLAGRRGAIAATVEFGLVGIERGEDWFNPIPPETIVHAHRAARLGISLGTILCGYIACDTTFGDFAMEAADRSVLAGNGTTGLHHHLHKTRAALFERLAASIVDEYARELDRAQRSPEQRRATLVQKFLVGTHADSAELGYRLDAWHLGVIARGTKSRKLMRDLASALNLDLLQVAHGEETVWAWFGGPRRLPTIDIKRLMSSMWPPGISLAIGEPGKGIDGWRMTHRQAQAALRVALRAPQEPTRLADVVLVASLLEDEVLARSLKEIFLGPLGESRESEVLRKTLRAYFDARCNAATAAILLKVDRHTVERRLRAIEKLLGRLPQTCQAELEVALRLEQLSAL